MSLEEEMEHYRKPDYAIAPMILNRWSPRAMSGEPLEEETLMSLFEAARWAPSCFNDQPWRFLYARREGPHWEDFFGLLVEANQAWAKQAAVLVVAVSHKVFEYNAKPSPTHTFDTGAAWQNLALEGAHRGLVVHGMAGFDYERAPEVLGLPEDYAVEAMIAIGKPGAKTDLPEALQKKEFPSSRKPIPEFAWEGGFGDK